MLNSNEARNAPREEYSADRDKLEALENKCSMTYADLDLIGSNRFGSVRIESNPAARETRGSVEQCRTEAADKGREEERKEEKRRREEND